MGSFSRGSIDLAELKAQLDPGQYTDFHNAWNTFLKTSHRLLPLPHPTGSTQ
jgi:hypothetical protein